VLPDADQIALPDIGELGLCRVQTARGSAVGFLARQDASVAGQRANDDGDGGLQEAPEDGLVRETREVL